ncbi:MAG: rhamnulokinase, partial [Actinobacteria bacterium]|nr:rhamnulokinase [Actinomycetota bacterium]
MSKFIALDFGAESGRAVLGKIENEKLNIEELHRFANRQVKVHGHIYWDLLNLFDELKNGLAKAAKNGHKDISGIGVDTWGVDFGLVSRDNHLIGNPYAYRDARTDGMMDKVFDIVPRQEIYEY